MGGLAEKSVSFLQCIMCKILMQGKSYVCEDFFLGGRKASGLTVELAPVGAGDGRPVPGRASLGVEEPCESAEDEGEDADWD